MYKNAIQSAPLSTASSRQAARVYGDQQPLLVQAEAKASVRNANFRLKLYMDMQTSEGNQIRVCIRDPFNFLMALNGVFLFTIHPTAIYPPSPTFKMDSWITQVWFQLKDYEAFYLGSDE
ncbi:hypothetical protein L1887_00172 [Cichorium endivia]|nr:hypothetical protein L1887_00172 [Cichorium endivia]